MTWTKDKREDQEWRTLQHVVDNNFRRVSDSECEARTATGDWQLARMGWCGSVGRRS